MHPQIISILEKQKYDNFSFESFDLEPGEFLIEYTSNKSLSIKKPPYFTSINEQRLRIVFRLIKYYFEKNRPSENYKFILNLTDCATHSKPIPCLCFAKNKTSNLLLIPNIDFFTHDIWRCLNAVREDAAYEEKIVGSIFAGTATGPLENNTRIRYCLDVLQKKDPSHLGRITCFDRPEDEWRRIYGDLNPIISKTVPITDQLAYKILTNIDGHTVCYSRLFWQMASNSIPVYINKNNHEFQFFDYFDYSYSYYNSSLETYWADYAYILNPKNQSEVNDKISKGKLYSEVLFGEYLRTPDIFLYKVLKYILDRISPLPR